VVDVESLKSKGLVKKIGSGVKILGEGEVLRPLTVRAQAFSLSAKKKIEAAGGKAEVI
jgi:large subunit ribosomal protein L15